MSTFKPDSENTHMYVQTHITYTHIYTLTHTYIWLSIPADIPTPASPCHPIRSSDTAEKPLQWREGPFQKHNQTNPEPIISSVSGAHMSYNIKGFILCILNQQY